MASMPDRYKSVLLLLATPAISVLHVLSSLLPSVLQWSSLFSVAAGAKNPVVRVEAAAAAPPQRERLLLSVVWAAELAALCQLAALVGGALVGS